MAEYTLIGRHPNLVLLTENVTEDCVVKNEAGEPMTLGVMVEVTRGQYKIQHIDADSMVEAKPGQTVTIDPTAVSGAVGVCYQNDRSQVLSTGDIKVSKSGIVVAGGKAKAKAKK